MTEPGRRPLEEDRYLQTALVQVLWEWRSARLWGGSGVDVGQPTQIAGSGLSADLACEAAPG